MANRELKVCGRRGHVTYLPDEPDLADRLRGSTALGDVWRCLRCGEWVLGRPTSRGPASQAPVPARGRALRQLTILRVLAVERILRALVLVIASYGLLRFASAQSALRDYFGQLVPAARPLAERLGIDLDQSAIVREATRVLQAQHGTLSFVALGLLGYGLLEGVEGMGLWLAKRWAEYLTVVATAAFLPLEVVELTRTVTVTKVGAFLINIGAVLYLIVAKRLFGARGGQAAYEEKLRGESLLEVREAGRKTALGKTAQSGRDIGMSTVDESQPERPWRG